MKRIFYSLVVYFFFSFCIISLNSCKEDNSTITNNNNNNNANPQIQPVAVPSGERIFFMKAVDNKILIITDSIQVGTADIYSIKPDGTDELKHTNLSASFFVCDNPEISYDGKYLTFTSNYNSWVSACYTDVFLWDLARNTARRVTGDERPFPPTRTATLRVTGGFHEGRVSAKGSQKFTNSQTVKTDSGDYEVAVLTVPAGENIWVKSEYNREYSSVAFTYQLEGTTESIFVSPLNKDGIAAEKGTLSPDVNKLVCMLDGKIAVFDLTKGIVWDKNIGGHTLGYSDYPVYSHDGSKVALCWGQFSYANTLGILSPPESEGNPTIIFPEYTLGGTQLILSPSWSPDDKEIVFLGAVIGGKGSTGNVFKLNVATKQLVQLTDFSGQYTALKPCFSPDGTKIVFTVVKCKNVFMMDILDFVTRDNIEGADLFIIPSNGGAATQLTHDGKSYNPSWGVVKK